MITAYLFDDEMISAGTIQVDPMAPFPSRATIKAPPRLAGTQVARWLGSSWEVLPERPAPVVPVPLEVSRSQARRALLLRGLLERVQPTIEAIPDATERALAQIEWDDAQVFKRHHPLVAMIGQALDLDEAGLDDLFIFAATLP
jgi:hypothetical protein